MKYKYEVYGNGSVGTWATSGTAEAATAGQFAFVPNAVLKESFEQLTQGKAVFGEPGVGCKGPYTITKMLIELEE
jgi:hypothetical protein